MQNATLRGILVISGLIVLIVVVNSWLEKTSEQPNKPTSHLESTDENAGPESQGPAAGKGSHPRHPHDIRGDLTHREYIDQLLKTPGTRKAVLSNAFTYFAATDFQSALTLASEIGLGGRRDAALQGVFRAITPNDNHLSILDGLADSSLSSKDFRLLESIWLEDRRSFNLASRKESFDQLKSSKIKKLFLLRMGRDLTVDDMGDKFAASAQNFTPEEKSMILGSMLEGMGRKDPDKALHLGLSQDVPIPKDHLLRLSQFGSTSNPEKYVKNFGDGEGKLSDREAINHFFIGWSVNEPQQLADWISSRPPSTNPEVVELATHQLTLNLMRIGDMETASLLEQEIQNPILKKKIRIMREAYTRQQK